MIFSIVVQVEPTGPARCGGPDDQRRETREALLTQSCPGFRYRSIRATFAAETAHVDPEFIRELFAPFGAVTVKRMFGGAGIWSDGLMFALVFDGAIFLKVDDASIPDFEREGSRPFVYTRAKSPGRVGRASLSYWRLPERLYDDPDELAVWAGRALAIAQRKKVTPRKRAKPKPSRRTRSSRT
jgi:DNA transformation protein and related proteins